MPCENLWVELADLRVKSNTKSLLISGEVSSSLKLHLHGERNSLSMDFHFRFREESFIPTPHIGNGNPPYGGKSVQFFSFLCEENV